MPFFGRGTERLSGEFIKYILLFLVMICALGAINLTGLCFIKDNDDASQTDDER